MKKIKRIFIILILSITLFTSSYERVDAVAIPIGIGLKAILTYGLVAIGGLVAIDYTLDSDLDAAQFYNEYTDVMDKELEEYAEETDRSDIYYNFKDNNYHKKNQPFIPDVNWNDDIKKLFKDFGKHIRNQYIDFPDFDTFLTEYGLEAYINSANYAGVKELYNDFVNTDVGEIYVFEDDTKPIDDLTRFQFVYSNASFTRITVYENSILITPTKSDGYYLNTRTCSYAHSTRYYTDPPFYSIQPNKDYKLIDILGSNNSHPRFDYDYNRELPPIRGVDELKKEGLLVGGNKDIMIKDAQWVEDIKKKGKTVDDVDLMYLDGDMDVDGNYIPSNVIPIIPDDVWVDAIEKNIPWDKVIEYPKVIIHDDDDIVVNTPDYPDDTKPDVYVPKNINAGDNPELVRTDLKMVFPFCIPFDLIDAIKLFNAPPKAPVFEIPIPMGEIGHETITIDMQEFESLAQIFRIFMTIMFIMSLIVITRQIIKG